MRPLFILGSGGFACEVALWLRDAPLTGAGWSFEGFVTDDPAKVGASLPLGRVVGTEEQFWARPRDAGLLVGLGKAATRRLLTARALEAGFALPNLVHPRALVPVDQAQSLGLQLPAQRLLVARGLERREVEGQRHRVLFD